MRREINARPVGGFHAGCAASVRIDIEMMAANLRRRHPGATPDEIERLLEAWLAERPGAELGDGVGVLCP
ncbi:MAG TPA: hypothetical protein VNO30_36115 [Kofleriaceae bacterium]|nr:hypothetical protein [Kofleriaceae bacterium]